MCDKAIFVLVSVVSKFTCCNWLLERLSIFRFLSNYPSQGCFLSHSQPLGPCECKAPRSPSFRVVTQNGHKAAAFLYTPHSASWCSKAKCRSCPCIEHGHGMCQDTHPGLVLTTSSFFTSSPKANPKPSTRVLPRVLSSTSGVTQMLEVRRPAPGGMAVRRLFQAIQQLVSRVCQDCFSHG